MTEAREGTEVRGTHPYVYRSGEWALIQQEFHLAGRRLWLVTFEDGDVDWWPADDPVAGYEFREQVRS